MNAKYIAASAMLVICGISAVGLVCLRRSGAVPEAPTRYSRIISMVPSVTEVLFALDLGERVVGVTSFCTWPPEARLKPRLGGYYDPNYEALVAVEPDLVITMPEQTELRSHLQALGLQILTVDQRSIGNILNSIEEIGKACGEGARARATVMALRDRMHAVAEKTKGLPRPRVLVCVGRDVTVGTLDEVYVTGGRGFLNEIITAAGGVNVMDPKTAMYPRLSTEGLILLEPDIIIDMLPGLAKTGVSAKAALGQWQVLSPAVDAIKNGRVYAFTENYVVIPGPRFVLTLELMARIIHPEADWDAP